MVPRVLLGVAAALVVLASPAEALRLRPRLRSVDPCWLLAHQPADPGAQTLTVVNQANVDPENLCRVEAAVQDQAVQLRAAWGTPPIRFGTGGWLVTLQSTDAGLQGQSGGHWIACSGPYCAACVDAQCSADTWTPYARVNALGACMNVNCTQQEPWSVAFSHEVMEMLADPSTSGQEVCDPLGGQSYRLDGVNVARFVTPRGLSSGST